MVSAYDFYNPMPRQIHNTTDAFWIQDVLLDFSNNNYNEKQPKHSTVYITIQPNPPALLYISDFQVKSKIPLYWNNGPEIPL